MQRFHLIQAMMDEFSKVGYEIDLEEIELIDIICQLDPSYQLHNIMIVLNQVFDLPKNTIMERHSWEIIHGFHQRLIDLQGVSDDTVTNFDYCKYLDDCVQYTNTFGESQFSRFRSTCERRRNLRREFAQLDTPRGHH